MGVEARRDGQEPRRIPHHQRSAEDLDLPQHVLRFWETRFPQIKPLKRGGGRRYYRPDDVELLRAIKQLLYGEGYTIKGVQKLFKEQGARAVAARRTGRTPPPLSGRPASNRRAAEANAADGRRGLRAGALRQLADVAALRAALADIAEARAHSVARADGLRRAAGALPCARMAPL